MIPQYRLILEKMDTESEKIKFWKIGYKISRYFPQEGLHILVNAFSFAVSEKPFATCQMLCLKMKYVDDGTVY